MNVSKNFFLIASLFIPIIFGVVLPWPELLPFPTWPCFIGFVMLCLAFSPDRLRDAAFSPILKLSHFIGIINQTIIMFIIFYTLFVPIALVRRLMGIDALKIKIIPRETHWRTPDEKTINFDRPY